MGSQLTLIWPPARKWSTLKGRIHSQRVWCAGKQTGSHKAVSRAENGRKTYQVYLVSVRTPQDFCYHFAK